MGLGIPLTDPMCTAGDTGFNLRSGDAVAAPVLGPWLMGTSCALSTSGAPPDGPMSKSL